MRERTPLAHGEFAAESYPGRGSAITCRVPFGGDHRKTDPALGRKSEELIV